MKAVALSICAMLAFAMGGEAMSVSRQVFGDDARREVVNGATRVEACILRVDDSSRGGDLNRRVLVEGRYQLLPEEISTLITWKLLDGQNFTWDAVPACIPTYNARVRFSAGARAVDVDFCFSCAVVRVLEGGKLVGSGYFENGSDWVFRALETQFSREPVIRELKQKREERELVRLQIEMAKARDARKEKTSSGSAPDAERR